MTEKNQIRIFVCPHKECSWWSFSCPNTADTQWECHRFKDCTIKVIELLPNGTLEVKDL